MAAGPSLGYYINEYILCSMSIFMSESPIYCLFHVTWPRDIFTNKVIPNSDRSYLLNAVQEFDEKCTIQLG